MKQLSLLLVAMLMAVTTFSQNDPLSLSAGRGFGSAAIPTYTSGGFKVLVKNNTTGRLELTSYTVTDDTVNAGFMVKGLGSTSHAIDVTTNTYKQLWWVGMSSQGAGKVRVQDSANAVKYLEIDAYTGIKAKDTLFNNAKFLSVKTATGNTILTADTARITFNAPKIYFGSESGPFLSYGSGTPLGVLSAPVGSLYIRTNGVADSTLYIKSSGTGNTGWYPAGH